MIIQCPSCGARAKLPDSKEGAKVRCGECQRIYVAGLGRGSNSHGGTANNQGLWIGIGVAVVIGLIFIFAVNSGGDKGAQAGPTQQDETPDAKAPRVDRYGYGGPAALAARDMHLLAFSLNKEDLRSRLHGPAVHAWKRRSVVSAATVATSEAAGLDKEASEQALEEALDAMPSDEDLRAEFESLSNLDRVAQEDLWVEELTTGSAKDLVADWKPYDGEAIELNSTDATVRLTLVPFAEGSFENRTVDWGLQRIGGRWLTVSWERHFTQSELDDILRTKISGRRGGTEKVERSDGSVVREREPEPLAHLEGSSPELRTRIDQLIVTMIDLDLTREATQARRDLKEIGKPAIPALLTKLYEIPLDSEDHSIQINQVVIALRGITGQGFGFQPMELVESGLGTSAEFRQSALKQWFAWWYRNERSFSSRVDVDPYADLPGDPGGKQ